MTTISIVREAPSHNGTEYRAIAGRKQSVGRTPGEALDAISAQLNEEEAGTLLVVQQMRPDRFFTETQQNRLAELMDAWRRARDGASTLPAEEAAELEKLIEAELVGSTRRAEALLNEIQS